jgi:hypothetical protein
MIFPEPGRIRVLSALAQVTAANNALPFGDTISPILFTAFTRTANPYPSVA